MYLTVVDGRVHSINDIENLVIATSSGVPVRFADFARIEDYGAKADGTTDASDALARACEAAGLVLFAVPAPTPFLMVARTYWRLLAQAGHEELSSALGAHRDLVRAAAGSAPVPTVVRTLAGAVEGWRAVARAWLGLIQYYRRASRDSRRGRTERGRGRR